MKVVYAYLETFGTEPGRDGDRYEYMRLGADAPLGLGTVRAYAEQDRFLAGKVTSCNRTFRDGIRPEKAADGILWEEPDVVAFGLYIWNAEATFRAARRLKAKDRRLRIVLGGPEVPRDRRALAAFLRRHPMADAAVTGEGEEAFAELLKACLNGSGLRRIKGLAFREGRKVVVNPPRPGVADLRKVPSPFVTGAVRVLPQGMLCVEGSRGCPYACAYCDYLAGSHRLRLFPMARLKAELRALVRKGFRGCVCFTDAMLNVPKARALEIFRLLQDFDLEFQMELKPEHFDDETIAALGKVRRPYVSVGVQTTSPAALKNMNRKLDLGRSSENIRKLLTHPNIKLKLEFILGLPGDDYESFKETMDWAMRFVPRASLTLYDLALLPNAPLAGMVRRFGIRTDRRGMVAGSKTFGAAALRRASWLFGAYRWLRDTPGMERDLEKVSRSRGRPSDLLEQVAGRLRKSGHLPSSRIFGQDDESPSRKRSAS